MNLNDLVPFEQVLEEELRDPEFRAEWERLAPARAIANRLIIYRADNELSQTALGRILGMSQPAVARLEAAEHLPSLQTLTRLAERLDFEILVEITPPGRSKHRASPTIGRAAVTEQGTTPRGAALTVAIR
jgi:DNA-binding XRE family transcriptional regulator